MEELNAVFVKKGMYEPLVGLCDEARVHAGLGRKFEAELAACNWSAADTAEVEALADSLGTSAAARAEAQVTAKNTTVDERTAKALAKALIGRFRIAGALALATTSLPNVSRDSFEAGHALGQSTPKIIAFLEKLGPPVAALDEAMRPYLGGESPSALLETARANLVAAQENQESTGAVANLETRKIYETKGRLLSRIEAMNKIAKLAFYGRTDVAGLFNKDLLNRARADRKAAEIATAK